MLKLTKLKPIIEPHEKTYFFCICENNGVDQLCRNCAADQHLCFRYIDGTIPLLPKSEISSLWPSSMIVQQGLSGTWSETPEGLQFELIMRKSAFCICKNKDTDTLEDYFF